MICVVDHQWGVALSTDLFLFFFLNKLKSNLISKSGKKSSIFETIFKNLGLSPQ